MSATKRQIALVFLYAASLAIIGWLAWSGRSYYLTPMLQRARHALFWELKPGGRVGHAFGVAGSLMMIVMLLYSVRKRVPALHNFGTLRAWLDFHIYCGVIGPLLVVLHSTFKVQGIVALSFWSMIAVASSGVLGRYLYGQLPRRQSGDEIGLQEAAELHRRLADRLRDTYGLDASALARLDQISAGGLSQDSSLLTVLMLGPWRALAARRRLRAFLRGYRHLPRELRADLQSTARQRAQLSRRLLLWSKLRRLFHYWNVIHKPFAIVMYLFMAVHVGVALMTGYAFGASP